LNPQKLAVVSSKKYQVRKQGIEVKLNRSLAVNVHKRFTIQYTPSIAIMLQSADLCLSSTAVKLAETGYMRRSQIHSRSRTHHYSQINCLSNHREYLGDQANLCLIAVVVLRR